MHIFPTMLNKLISLQLLRSVLSPLPSNNSSLPIFKHHSQRSYYTASKSCPPPCHLHLCCDLTLTTGLSFLSLRTPTLTFGRNRLSSEVVDSPNSVKNTHMNCNMLLQCVSCRRKAGTIDIREGTGLHLHLLQNGSGSIYNVDRCFVRRYCNIVRGFVSCVLRVWNLCPLTVLRKLT